MKMVHATIAVFALFSLACVGSRVKYQLLDTGAPVSGHDGDGDSDSASDSASDTAVDTGGNGDGNVIGFNGTMTITHGSSSKPKDYDCELVFNATGTPTEVNCPECEWTLRFDLFYDDERSSDDDDCYDGSDMIYTLGYDADYYGGAYAMLWYYSSYYDWLPIFAATLDDSGGLVFTYGVVDDYSSYGGTPHYYTRYWYGAGTLSY